MSKSLGRRFLKAIRRTITAPLKGRLVNKRGKGFQPAHEDKPSATLRNHVPLPQNGSNSEKQAAKVNDCGPTIHNPKKASDTYNVVLDNGDRIHVPPVDTYVADRRQTLHDQGDRPQPAPVPKDSQQQHRPTKTASDLHRERLSSANTTLDISQTARATSNKAPAAAVDNSLEREQDTHLTCAAAVEEGHNRKRDSVPRVSAQVCGDSRDRVDPSTQASYMQKVAMYRPQGHVGRVAENMSDPNTVATQMKNTVLVVQQPGGFGRRRVGERSGCPAEDLPKSQSSRGPVPAPMMSLTQGSQGSESQVVAPRRPSSTASQPSRTSSTGQSHNTGMTTVPVDSSQQHQAPTARTLTDHNVYRLRTFLASRRQRRLATTRASPTTATTPNLTCSGLIKDARAYHGRVCRVRGAAESYARGFGLEVASCLYQYVVMRCTFDEAHGTLMVSLCALSQGHCAILARNTRSTDVVQIVSVKDPDTEQACEDAHRNKHLIPIEPNKPLPIGMQIRAGFGDESRHIGKHSWIDISKVYQVPVEFIKAGRHVSLKLCKCSWEKMREKLSMGTWTEERFSIEREFKRFQNTKGKEHTPDYQIRAADNILLQLQPQSQLQQHELRPRLRRYRVDELLHLQTLR
ncbi:hypothetical protein G647_02542 [Cladophialophora carrionii CBS 160.54]|uniref:Uncharacterized protein n=1 Tax=Cladophialophora carrionii CBS 160.54 TaxID=1279043 RepID=V9DHF6_9EURO|nr:uncharacterized protein G647_02542 [Cladophialophora carrionii CBS 160.54]ETI25768.1 hypothetical protein G647_02542 [Cladophialophora carrionii CBS 160.54]